MKSLTIKRSFEVKVTYYYETLENAKTKWASVDTNEPGDPLAYIELVDVAETDDGVVSIEPVGSITDGKTIDWY